MAWKEQPLLWIGIIYFKLFSVCIYATIVSKDPKFIRNVRFFIRIIWVKSDTSIRKGIWFLLWKSISLYFGRTMYCATIYPFLRFLSSTITKPNLILLISLSVKRIVKCPQTILFSSECMGEIWNCIEMERMK